MVKVEEINGRRVLPFDEADLQVPHEPGRRHPEIIPHHHDGLDMLAIAVTKGGDQFRVLLTPPRKQPLLELIQDQQHLALGWQDATLSQVRQRLDQPQFSRQFRTDLAQALEQPGFRLIRGRLDVNRQDVLAEPGQKSRLDQRRLAAARGAVDQPDLESQVGVDLLDLALPELDAVRQSVPIPRTGQEFQEEVGIMLIERSQPSWDDLDRSLVGVGLPGGGRGWSGFQG